MAIEFPLSSTSPWLDQHGQTWVHNGKNWVRQAADPGIEEAPNDGQQYVRESEAWAINNPDEWYLGPLESAPFVDNNGGPLQPGMVYFDIATSQTLVWDGVSWGTFSPQYTISTVAEFVWDSSAEIAVEGSPIWPDDYGNNPANWVNGQTFITVYVDGNRKLNEYNASLVTGDYIVDYTNNTIIIKNNVVPLNAKLVIQQGVIESATHIAVEDNNSSGWAFVIDEDNMISDLDTKLPTQQSVKAYVDAEVAKLSATVGGGTGGGDTARAMAGVAFDFAGPGAPTGSLECDGSVQLIADYPDLYAAIGDTWAVTGGAVNPDTLYFRLPPQNITVDGNTFGLYARGKVAGVAVGTYETSQNKRHQHNADHNHAASIGSGGGHGHTGSTNNTGNHNHNTNGGSGGTYNTDNNGAAPVLKINAGATSSNGSHSHTVNINSVGGHSHSISLTSTNVNTANQGELEARPESVTYLRCIWTN